jgi:GntR family transcriptional regulator, arabinose operon transcriptional repressor
MPITDAARSPKYQVICKTIRDAIASGEYKPGQRLPSEADFVKTFDASRITVNRALRELQLVGIIDRRAGSGSYVRAQSRKTFTFGLLIPELGQTEIFEPMCRGMAMAEEGDNQHSLLWSRALSDSEPKEAQATESCRRMVAEKVAGVFFAPVELTSAKDAVNQTVVETLDKAGIPVVLLDRDVVAYPQRSRYDLVGIDNRRAGFAITEHLLSVGCKRIAFLARPGSAPTVEARIAGYRDAILTSGHPWDRTFVQGFAPWERSAVAQMLETLKPDAVLCANDFTAANLMRTLGELGVVVPDQVKLAGFDDVKYAGLLPVPLTTIRQPCDTMGVAAVSAMMQRIKNPDLPARDVLLDFRLIIRDSTGRRPHN